MQTLQLYAHISSAFLPPLRVTSSRCALKIFYYWDEKCLRWLGLTYLRDAGRLFVYNACANRMIWKLLLESGRLSSDRKLTIIPQAKRSTSSHSTRARKRDFIAIFTLFILRREYCALYLASAVLAPARDASNPPMCCETNDRYIRRTHRTASAAVA